MSDSSLADENAGGANAAANRRGILLVILATAMFVALDATAKYLSQSYPVPQVMWARFFFHLVVVLVLCARRLPAVLYTQRPGLQFVRSILMLATNGAFFFAIQSMPLADATAIVFAGPLLITALSVPLLGEHVGPRRWVAVAIGFLGALVIIRPGPGILQGVAVLPLISATLFSLYQISTRVLSRFDDPMTTLLYTSVLGAFLLTCGLPWYWRAPDLEGWLLMAFAGFVGALSQLALIKAIESAPLSVIAPFNYVGLVWAISLGYLVFGDLPDALTFVGAAIIVASGLYVLHREKARAAAALPAGTDG